MQTLIKTVVLTVLVSFCAPLSIGAAAEGAPSTSSIASAKARPSVAGRKKRHKRAAKRDTKRDTKQAAKASSHEL